jgi:hypothetical protein
VPTITYLSYHDINIFYSLTGAAQRSRSPSPTDEDLLDEAIANLVDFDMDGEQAETPVDDNKTNRSNTPKFERVLGKRPRGASGTSGNHEFTFCPLMYNFLHKAVGK